MAVSAISTATAPDDTPPHDASEQEPFIVEPDTPNHPEDMGFDEQFAKPEGRQGDVIALWAAYVRPYHTARARTITHSVRSEDLCRGECSVATKGIREAYEP